MSSGLTLTQKIIGAHQIGAGALSPGNVVRIKVDWVMASELALKGMLKTFERLDHRRLADPKRFYLAIDHTVDPVTLAEDEKTIELVRLSRDFAARHGLSAFYDANETIMHTRFYRDHCLPGQVVIGADSHTSSHGAVGALAIGLGGADVAIAAVRNETWLEIPEAILVTYNGRLNFGLSGKDIILKTLGTLGRNTVALERSVEYRAEDADSLSTDARFTICNMTAEFGGINGIFEPSGETLEFLRHRERSTDGARFLRADADADYVETFSIDLTQLAPQVARPYSPDNVCDVGDAAGKELDGCFIGSCTTTEEELILGGLVLEKMLESGVRPKMERRRLVVPGDRAIGDKLAALGLLDVYINAGFRVGVPGCHLCLGLGSERAGEGETWLSSQNRNYHNRMGKGSLAWLASAATVAASSLSMRITDPRPYIAGIDPQRYSHMIGRAHARIEAVTSVEQLYENFVPVDPGVAPTFAEASSAGTITGRVQRFGDHIDTDAIIPGEFCSITDWSELGRHCFAHVRPDFPDHSAAGRSIVVAGEAWGTGSAREHAVWALIGAGVTLVIARSFSATHRRNCVNEGLPTLVVKDDSFFDLVSDDAEVAVDLDSGEITHLASGRVFRGRPPAGIAGHILAQGGAVNAIRVIETGEVP